MNRVVPSSTELTDQVEKKIDIDDEKGSQDGEKLNNNNYNNNNNLNTSIILDGSSRANELLNGLTTAKGEEGKEDGLSMECISSSSRKASFIVHPEFTDDDSTSPTPLIMSAVETGIPAIEYSHSFSTSNNVRFHQETEGSSSEGSSSSNSCSWFRRLLGLHRSRNIDKRLASSYTSFHVGRFLAITGSLTLLGGLFLKFLMLHDEKFWSIITWFAASAGLVLIFIGAALVLWAALVKAQQARKEFEEKLHSSKLATSTGKLRPPSALSSSSFNSNNSRVPILGNHLSPSTFPPSDGLRQDQSPSGHSGSKLGGNDTIGNNLNVNFASSNHGNGFTSSPPLEGNDTSSNNPFPDVPTPPFSTWEKY